jgi:hypothetical protein
MSTPETLIDMMFPPGDLHDAAQGINYLVHKVVEHGGDRDIIEATVEFAMSCVAIMAEVNEHHSLENIKERIDSACAHAEVESTMDFVAEMMRRHPQGPTL